MGGGTTGSDFTLRDGHGVMGREREKEHGDLASDRSDIMIKKYEMNKEASNIDVGPDYTLYGR